MTARRVGLALLAALGACARAIRRQNALPVVLNAEEARVRVVETRLRIDSALVRVDIQRLLRQMTTDVTVVLASGDSARGRDAVAALINRNFHYSIGARFQMFPSKRDLCLDGAVEYDSDFIGYVAFADHVDTLGTRYAAKWYNAGADGWLLQRLVFGATAAGPRPGSDVCERASVAQFNASGFRVGILAPFVSLQPLVTKQSLENRLHALAYTTGTITLSTLQDYSGPFTSDDRGGSPGMLFARFRVRGPFWLQALASYTPQTFSSIGENAAVGSRVRIDVTSQMAGGTVQYEWRQLRVGAGVVVVTTGWNEYEDRRTLFATRGQVRQQQSTSIAASLVEVACTMAISSRLGVELRLMQRHGQDNVPAFGRIPGGLAVSMNQTMFGGLIELAF